MIKAPDLSLDDEDYINTLLARIEELEAKNARLRKAWLRFDKAIASHPARASIVLMARKALKGTDDHDG
jgi:N12 class adenine-specific DNA methylase